MFSPWKVSSIEKVEYTSKHPVHTYNLSVDEDESYVLGTNGMIVHNCRHGHTRVVDDSIEKAILKQSISYLDVPVTIQTRRGAMKNGRACPAHYGEIPDTLAPDGDPVDVFVGPHTNNDAVFIVTKLHDDGSFDEHKVFLGYRDPYKANEDFDAVYGVEAREGTQTLTWEEFHQWLEPRTEDGVLDMILDVDVFKGWVPHPQGPSRMGTPRWVNTNDPKDVRYGKQPAQHTIDPWSSEWTGTSDLSSILEDLWEEYEDPGAIAEELGAMFHESGDYGDAPEGVKEAVRTIIGQARRDAIDKPDTRVTGTPGQLETNYRGAVMDRDYADIEQSFEEVLPEGWSAEFVEGPVESRHETQTGEGAYYHQNSIKIEDENGLSTVLSFTRGLDGPRGDQIFVTHIYNEYRAMGTGMGSVVLESLKNLADGSGMELVFEDVRNPRFFNQFPWLEVDDSRAGHSEDGRGWSGPLNYVYNPSNELQKAWVPDEARAGPRRGQTGWRNTDTGEFRWEKPEDRDPVEDEGGVPTLDEVKDGILSDPSVQEAESNVGEAYKNSTWKKFQETGQWPPGRQGKHKEIVDLMLNPKAANPPGVQPKAIVMVGRPGAGKSYSLGQVMGDDEYTVLDPDKAKSELPEFMKGVGHTATLVHEESGYIRDLAQDEALRRRHNTTFDSTGKDPEKMGKLVDMLGELGYDVSVVLVDVPPAVGLKRSYNRFKDPNDGRWVPLKFHESIGDGPNRSYASLKGNPNVGSFYRFDNSVDGRDAELVERGGTDGVK